MTELGLCVSHLNDGEEVPAVALLRGTGLCRECCVENATERESMLDSFAEDMSDLGEHLDRARDYLAKSLRRE